MEQPQDNITAQAPNGLPAPAYRVGGAIRDITCVVKGVGMLGWADVFNTVEDVHDRIHARAFVIETADGGAKLAYVNAEICFVTIAMRQAILDKLQTDYPQLGYNEHNVLLTAQHTHSAPGGISHYLMYNMSIPGFCPEVFYAYVNGIVEAIVEADAKRRPAHIYYTEGYMPDEVEVAWNRSLDAYNMNPDVEPLPMDKRHLAVDRTMYFFRIDGADGLPIGSINWFGVHTTSVHRNLHTISADNKGWASQQMEREIRQATGAEDYLAVFAQNAPGDVTPNIVKHPGRIDLHGPDPDDFVNMQTIGNHQADLALRLHHQAAKTAPLEGRLQYLTAYVNMANTKVEEPFAMGHLRARTGPPAFGVGFLSGTAEGGGIPRFLTDFVAFLGYTKGLVDEEIHGDYRVNLVETGLRRVFGESRFKDSLPPWLHPQLLYINRIDKNNAYGTQPFTPDVVPVQAVVLGNVGLVHMAAEPTVVAARRIRNAVAPVFANNGVKNLVIAGYANGYAGYITTREEHSLQRYEGTHTLFGQWTCGAYQTVTHRLVQDLFTTPERRSLDYDLRPYRFPWDELKGRTFRELRGDPNVPVKALLGYK